MEDPMRIKLCANCNAVIDRHSKICRTCYFKSIEKDPEEWRIRHNEISRQWRIDNPERSKEIMKKSRARWVENNPGRAKEVQRLNRERVRKQILELLGGVKCARCGFADWRALQVDHIHGGGKREALERGYLLTAASGLWKFRALILEDSEEALKKYQVLCANCNWIKRHENNECAKR